MDAPLLAPDNCYQALKTHDARFDGRFFVGVATTGIYCRPICRVRLPRQQNCRFFPSAAAAEAAGFRPCLRCRPELAPGFAATEASAKLARAAARMIESGAANRLDAPGGMAALAARLGITERHLRRLFVAEFGVAPVQYAQTHRLLLAKRLLTDTTLPVADIAFASGFASLRRMNALFLERYGFSPTRLRQAGRADAGGDDALDFLLPYRPPYDFAGLIAFLDRRAIPGVEDCGDGVYRRTLRITDAQGKEHAGWLEMTHDAARQTLRLRFAASLAGAAQTLLARAKQVFDTGAEPEDIAVALGTLAQGHAGLRLPGAFDPFELSLRAVLGQQVSVAAARTLAARFVGTFGASTTTPFTHLNRVFPAPQQVAALQRDDIARLGIVGKRAEAMIVLARAFADGTLDLAPGSDPAAAIATLTALPGLGPWTAHYIAMRALSWPDAWPPGDVALLAALGQPRSAAGQRRAEAIAAPWRPWRSYAVLHLWRRGAQTLAEKN